TLSAATRSPATSQSTSAPAQPQARKAPAGGAAAAAAAARAGPMPVCTTRHEAPSARRPRQVRGRPAGSTARSASVTARRSQPSAVKIATSNISEPGSYYKPIGQTIAGRAVRVVTSGYLAGGRSRTALALGADPTSPLGPLDPGHHAELIEAGLQKVAQALAVGHQGRVGRDADGERVAVAQDRESEAHPLRERHDGDELLEPLPLHVERHGRPRNVGANRVDGRGLHLEP